MEHTPELVEDIPIHFVKVIAGTHMPVVVTPTAYDGVELLH